MRIVCTLLATLAVFTSALAQPIPWEPILKKAAKVQQAKSPTLEGVVSTLKPMATTEQERAMLLFAYTAMVLRYDASVLTTTQDREEVTARNALNRGTGVCLDYVRLYKYMAGQMGIQTLDIQGYSRPKLGDPVDVEHADHAWLLVKVDNHWRIVDPTWGSTHVSKLDMARRIIDTSWYDISPDVAIMTHMPASPMFQLIEPPVAFNTWLNYDKQSGKASANSKQPGVNWADSLARYVTMKRQEQMLMVGRHSYAHNPENEELYGIASLNYGSSLSSTNKVGSISSVAEAEKILMTNKAMLPHFERAVQLLAKSKAELAAQGSRIAQRNLENTKQSITTMQGFVDRANK